MRPQMAGMSSPPLRYTAFGTTLALGGSHRVVLQQAESRLRWLGWTPAEGGDSDVDYELRASAHRDGALRCYELRCDGSLLFASTELAPLLDAFENHVKLLTASRAEGQLFVHAGAVSWHGRGVILPGRSRAGKTTLVRALVEAGAAYYSDEFAVLDAEGQLHPYPLPLSIRGNETRPAVRMAVESIGGRAGTAPVPIALIAVTRYRSHAAWRPRPLSPGQALLALMENTVAARLAPRTAMATLGRTVLRASAVSSARGDARRAAAAILVHVDAAR